MAEDVTESASREVFARMPALAQRWRSGVLDDACYASLYFLYGQIGLHGRRYASRRYRADPRPDAAAWLAQWDALAGDELRARLLHCLERFHFVGVIPNVPAALCAWLRGLWPLEIREQVPRAVDVLRLQARGRRLVTVIAAYPRLLQPVLNKPHAWAFMVHDLEHAYKFFYDEELCRSQQRFFKRIERALTAGRFERPLQDAVFADKFDYLISDMNTHGQHSRQYLRAILIEFLLRAEQKPLHAALSPASQAALSRMMAGFEGESDVAPAQEVCI